MCTVRYSTGVELTDEDIQEFIKIYRDEFKEELSVDAAREMARRVLNLYLVLATESAAQDKKSSGEVAPAPEPSNDEASRVRTVLPLARLVVDIQRSKKPDP